jgi:hypothetical protein
VVEVAKLVESEEQREEPHSATNKLVEWSAEWQMMFKAERAIFSN